MILFTISDVTKSFFCHLFPPLGKCRWGDLIPCTSNLQDSNQIYFKLICFALGTINHSSVCGNIQRYGKALS